LCPSVFAAKDLIRRLVTVNPDERYSIPQALAHPWLQDAAMRERVDSLLCEVEERKKLLTDSQAIELSLDKSPASHSLYAAQAIDDSMHDT
jgi:serine/threonine protein kinase